MKKFIFYSYLKCSTCRKAAKWLDNKAFEYQLIDIVKEPPLLKYINLALDQYSLDKKRVFNTRGKSFKGIDSDIKDLSNEKIIELLSNDGKLIKRPFLIVNESKFIMGFDESEYEVLFK